MTTGSCVWNFQIKRDSTGDGHYDVMRSSGFQVALDYGRWDDRRASTLAFRVDVTALRLG